MAQKPVKHGRTHFYIEGEQSPEPIISPRLKRMLPQQVAAGAGLTEAAPATDTSREFRFSRMFPNLDKFQPDDLKLIDLGQSLEDSGIPVPGDSDIPAGFTYFGQFVDHDITFDRTELLPDAVLTPEDILSGRSPALELDSVYGAGPKLNPELYAADQIHLIVGATTGRTIFGTDIVNTSLPNDLPRRPMTEPIPDDRQRAFIGDPRNDENLIVAQTHLAFLKFHNMVVDRLAASGTPAADLFAAARKIVIQHYQSIVLHDFVKRLAMPTVFDDVIANGRKFYFPTLPTAAYKLSMPVEFSVAIYRLGHSMVRSAYQWNMVFSSTGRSGLTPELNLFFTFSQVSGRDPAGPAPALGGLPTLPTDWIVDWRRMYDFSEQPGQTRHAQLNLARPIDTRMADGLQLLPEFFAAQQPHLRSLGVRNLMRGRQVGLPTGQDVAKAMGLTPLLPTEVASGPSAARITGLGFDVKTPLWFYMLKEAEVQQGGLRLGEMGSRILVETFHGLIAGSEHSILAAAGWTPSLPAANPAHFRMTDLLTLVNDINPLGEGP